MALNAFLMLEGTIQGHIKGGVTQRGREHTIVVVAANHEVMSPMGNAGGGAAIGKRIHKPFVITKELDKSSPLLYQAMAKAESMAIWELKFYTLTGSGIEIQHYTVKLTGALITGIRFSLPDTKDTDAGTPDAHEEIEFSYRSIEWIWTDGSITATDQW